MSSLRAPVLAAKQRLAEGMDALEARHRAGSSGLALGAAISDLRDAVLLDLTEAALADLGQAGSAGLWSRMALVAHGGYGRRDVAPYSDVDVMILHAPSATDRVAPLAKRLLRDVFDAGLSLGHSTRTPAEACRLACNEPMICTSLVESRLLRGSEALFHRAMRRFRSRVRRRARWLIDGIVADRLKERHRYGETVFLLEPNIKRSPGALRDIQLIRWMGFVRHGTPDPAALRARGALTEEDLETILRAGEFLLQLRNELHFHGRQPNDVLDRAEQLRIADLRNYRPKAGLLPVEQFMQDYFRHTAAVSHIATQFVAKARARDRMARLITVLFGHRVEKGVQVGPAGILATRRGGKEVGNDLTAIVRLMDLANLYDTAIAASTWEAIRRRAPQLPDETPSPAACRHFLSLLKHPARLGPLLRDLHDAHVLERFLPEFGHARGLLQFNQYHKYTVDEHCLRAVEFATELSADKGPLGRVYRPLVEKHLLHLAILIHDLGKGHLEDHREVGGRIAVDAGKRLGLPARDIEVLRVLVHKHMLLNHLAFRRDTADEQLAVQFAVQVGSPELLQMLYIMTAADLGAVGPGVWDGWKLEVVTDLYHRTMQHLAGESPETTIDDLLRQRRAAVSDLLGAEGRRPWFVEHLAALPSAYLNATPPRRMAADLRLLHDLGPAPNAEKGNAGRCRVATATEYHAETATIDFTVGTYEQVAPGIFHRLTGALSSRGLEIRMAQIHTLSDGLVLDRFSVHDPDYAGEPPPSRLQEIQRWLVESLANPTAEAPSFRRTWQVGGHRPAHVPGVPTRVNIDNSTSSRFTIIDIFSRDRTGLLYVIARTLFELGLSVGRAKIGTFLDQVVDVFYVTDGEQQKIDDAQRLETIRQRLIEVVEGDDNSVPAATVNGTG
jgi:[protein-PII] uridylyltransferase